jgi:putative ABC transport system substrate-binding protein
VKRRDLLLAVGGSLTPGVLRAQQVKRECRLGLLLISPFPATIDPFVAALNERGWTLGRNLKVDTRITAAEQERAPEMAKELIQQGADIIVVTGTANAVAARQASKTVPIVALACGYPVESGLASSLARPGGNVTGLTVYAGTEIFAKAVSLARELVPGLKQLGVFWAYAPPFYPQVEVDICLKEMRLAAELNKMRTRVWINRNTRELDQTLAEAAGLPLEALFLTAGGPQSMPEGIAKVAAFCERRRLPAVGDIAGNIFAAAGVVANSPVWKELAVRGASFVDRIMRGAKPGDLPIEYPTRYELVVNAKRAKVIGLEIPRSILARADRVIE